MLSSWLSSKTLLGNRHVEEVSVTIGSHARCERGNFVNAQEMWNYMLLLWWLHIVA